MPYIFIELNIGGGYAMNTNSSYYIIVNSKNIKTCFYYKDSAIYYNSIDNNNFGKEKVLINKVFENFICTISENDTIYILCEALNKDVLLFTNDGSGWNMNKISAFANITYFFPVKFFFINGNLNILFYSKPSLADYFNIYHAIRKKDRWEIFNICKLLSTEINQCISKTLIRNNIVNLVCTANNDNQIILKHFIYDSLTEKWYENKIINLYCNESLKITIQASYNEIYLICSFIENKDLNFLIFKKKNDLKSPFSLLDSNKIFFPYSVSLLHFELKDYTLKITDISDYKMRNWNYDLQRKIILSEIQLPHNFNTTKLRYVRLIKNIGFKESIEEDKIFSMDENSEMKEFQFKISNTSPLSGDKWESFETDSDSTTNEIVNRIESLSEKISKLDDKFMKLMESESKYNEYNSCNYDNKTSSINEERMPLKDSNFKEKFMKSKPKTFNLNDGVVLNGKFSDYIVPDKKKESEEMGKVNKTENSAIKVEAVANEKNRFLKAIESLFKA